MSADKIGKAAEAAGSLSKSGGGAKGAASGKGSSALPTGGGKGSSSLGAGGTMPTPDSTEQGMQVPGGGGGGGGGKSNLGRNAGMAAAAPGAAAASQFALLAAFMGWLKTLFFSLMAMAMNLLNMLWGLAVAAFNAAVGFVAGVGAAVAGALGTGASAIATGVATLTSGFVAVGMVGGALITGAVNGDIENAMRNDPLIDCGPSVQRAMMNTDVPDGEGPDTSAQTEANAKRVYAIYGGAGMPDENVAGMLGNWTAESGIDPTGVETIFDEPHQMGPRKQHAQSVGFKIDQVDAAYAAKYPAIDLMGIGLGQWTNGRNTLLIEYADSIGKPWHEIDTQLAFMVNADDPTRVNYIKTMMETPAGSPEQATLDFMQKWEGISDGSTGARVSAANSYFAKMPSWEKDADLADSVLGQVGTGSGGANNQAVANAVANCRTEEAALSADNSSAAMAMASYAWPTIDESRDNDGTPLYQELMGKIFPNDPYFMSCDRGVATAVRWSGTDDSYPVGPVSSQLDYLSTSDKWEEVTDWGGDHTNLQPGDILLRSDGQVGHTVMYLGPELVEQVFGSQAKPGSVIAHGSLGTRSPGVGGWDSNSSTGYGTYTVYRNVQKEANSKYVDIPVENSGNGIPGGGGTGSYIMPINAPVTSPYGYRIHPISGQRKMHNGIDFGAGCGTPIKAADGGTVVFAGPKGASGNRIDIDHGNGVTTGYFHQQSFAVSKGDTVSQGQVIGYVGTTGSSTGCHLHFTAAKGGGMNYFDPMTLY